VLAAGARDRDSPRRNTATARSPTAVLPIPPAAHRPAPFFIDRRLPRQGIAIAANTETGQSPRCASAHSSAPWIHEGGLLTGPSASEPAQSAAKEGANGDRRGGRKSGRGRAGRRKQNKIDSNRRSFLSVTIPAPGGTLPCDGRVGLHRLAVSLVSWLAQASPRVHVVACRCTAGGTGVLAAGARDRGSARRDTATARSPTAVLPIPPTAHRHAPFFIDRRLPRQGIAIAANTETGQSPRYASAQSEAHRIHGAGLPTGRAPASRRECAAKEGANGDRRGGSNPGAGRVGRRKANTTDSNRRNIKSPDATPRYSSPNTANAPNP